MDAAYFSAAIPEPYRILGLTLRPLSLGRYRLLKRFGCAFVADGDAGATIDDLLLGLVICSMRVDEFLEELNTDKLHRSIGRWGKKVCPHAWIGLLPFVGKWWRTNHMPNIVEKMGLFKAYLEAGSVVPKYWDEGGEGKQSGAHWSHSVEVVLRSEVGWTAEEINEAPLSRALADYFKFAESQGAVRLMSDNELALVEQMEGTNGA